VTIARRSTLAEVAVVVARALRDAGFEAVLTGGACATIYSAGAYQSRDLDFIVQHGGGRAALDAAMAAIGFTRKTDRYVHRSSSFFVEFPRGPLSIGDDLKIRPVELRIGRGRVRALSATDACRDRLAAFYYWSDRQSLASAVAIALRQRVSLARVKRWSVREGQAGRFEEFRAALRAEGQQSGRRTRR
jgi:hypothetical protein